MREHLKPRRRLRVPRWTMANLTPYQAAMVSVILAEETSNDRDRDRELMELPVSSLILGHRNNARGSTRTRSVVSFQNIRRWDRTLKGLGGYFSPC